MNHHKTVTVVVTDDRLEEARCEARSEWIGQCFETENLTLVRGGCRHEHIKERRLCPWHTEDVLDPESGAVCFECYEAGHDCPITAEVVTNA